MPFKSKAQRMACYAKHDPRWNCEKWDRETRKAGIKIEDLPMFVKKSSSKRSHSKRSSSVKRKTSPKRKVATKRSSSLKQKTKVHKKSEIHIGPKGGKYIIKNKKKMYIKK